MKNTPGPRAPPESRRPSLKMTALSYSWIIWSSSHQTPQASYENPRLCWCNFLFYFQFIVSVLTSPCGPVTLCHIVDFSYQALYQEIDCIEVEQERLGQCWLRLSTIYLLLREGVKVEKMENENVGERGSPSSPKLIIFLLSTKRLTWTTLMTAIRDNGRVARIRRQEPNIRMRDTIPGTWRPKIVRGLLCIIISWDLILETVPVCWVPGSHTNTGHFPFCPTRTFTALTVTWHS